MRKIINPSFITATVAYLELFIIFFFFNNYLKLQNAPQETYSDTLKSGLQPTLLIGYIVMTAIILLVLFIASHIVSFIFSFFTKSPSVSRVLLVLSLILPFAATFHYISWAFAPYISEPPDVFGYGLYFLMITWFLAILALPVLVNNSQINLLSIYKKPLTASVVVAFLLIFFLFLILFSLQLLGTRKDIQNVRTQYQVTSQEMPIYLPPGATVARTRQEDTTGWNSNPGRQWENQWGGYLKYEANYPINNRSITITGYKPNHNYATEELYSNDFSNTYGSMVTNRQALTLNGFPSFYFQEGISQNSQSSYLFTYREGIRIVLEDGSGKISKDDMVKIAASLKKIN